MRLADATVDPEHPARDVGAMAPASPRPHANFPLLTRLGRMGLLRVAPDEAREACVAGDRPEVALLRLCSRGCLEGGLRAALGVRPEELMGPLLHALGGAARTLKLVDVRDHPVLELHVLVEGALERWEVPELRALIHNVNDLYRGTSGVRRTAVLGEWEDALQLWCVPAAALEPLRREPSFQPENLREL